MLHIPSARPKKFIVRQTVNLTDEEQFPRRDDEVLIRGSEKRSFVIQIKRKDKPFKTFTGRLDGKQKALEGEYVVRSGKYRFAMWDEESPRGRSLRCELYRRQKPDPQAQRPNGGDGCWVADEGGD